MPERSTDFLLDDDDDLVIAFGDFQLAAGEVGIRQSIRVFLLFFLEEWFLDLARGMPYFQRIFIKNPSLVEVREHFRERLESVPGVRSIISLDVNNLGSRRAGVDWNVNTDVGELSGKTDRGV